MGKGAVDETLPTYLGIYAGSATKPELKERVEKADLVLNIGAIKSDFNTGGFTYQISQLQTIDFHSYTTCVKFSEYPGVRMHGVLRRLTKEVGKLNITPGPSPNYHVPQGLDEKSDVIKHEWLWPRLSDWLQSGDKVVTETGTSNFGIMETKFPSGVTAINQYLWGSIGWATGAAQGAAMAAREKDLGRTILWIGDGSLQLTAQAISTMLRNGLAPIIFVICNKGYTIERLIHGLHAKYNDIPDWRYKQLPEVFGAEEGQAKGYTVRTRKEFEELLADQEFSKKDSKVLRIAEVVMEMEDIPFLLKVTTEAAAKGIESS